MTEQEYNLAEGVRRSDLWLINDSPEKFKYAHDNPQEPTPALLFGSACHKMVLEPETFSDEYAIAPVCDRRTKDGKAVWEAFAEQNNGKTIITAADSEVMVDMEAALNRCSLAHSLIHLDGETEVPFFWTDAETGEKCKVKLDRLINCLDGRIAIVDYKTAKSAETNRFNSEIWKLGYHVQAAMYSEAVMICKNLDYRPLFLFVVQEKAAPYSVNVIEVSEDVMNAGSAKFHELLNTYHECKTVDMWPGYVDDVPNETYLPGWVNLDGDSE